MRRAWALLYVVTAIVVIGTGVAACQILELERQREISPAIASATPRTTLIDPVTTTPAPTR